MGTSAILSLGFGDPSAVPDTSMAGIRKESALSKGSRSSVAYRVWITAPRGPPWMGDKYLKLPKPWKQQLFKVILHTHKRKSQWSSPTPTAATQPFSLLVGGTSLGRGGKEKEAEQRIRLWGKQSAQRLLFLQLPGWITIAMMVVMMMMIASSNTVLCALFALDSCNSYDIGPVLP